MAAGWAGLLTKENLRESPIPRKEAQKRKNKLVMNTKGGCSFIMYYEVIITANVSIFSVPLAGVGVGGV